MTIAGLTSASATTLISTGNQATSVAISAIGHSSGTVTVTTGTAHGLTTGDVASIDGVADYTFCGVYTVTVTNANVFTYSQTASGASSSGGFSTKLTGTWGLYAGGTGPSLANGPVMINASSQMPALRVTQGGSGYALIVEDAANPDTSAFIISNAGDLAINTNKFTVAAATGNTVIGGTTSLAGNLTFATDATYDIGASGATRPRDYYGSRNLTAGGVIQSNATGGTSFLGYNNSSTGYASLRLFNDQNTALRALEIDYFGSAYASAPITGGVAGEQGLISIIGAYPLYIATSNTARLWFGATGNITAKTHLLFDADATYDIGASGATRARNLYLGGTIVTLNNASAVSISAVSSGGAATLNLNANTAGGFASQITFAALGTSKWALGGGNIGTGAANDFGMYDYANAKTTYTVLAASGNMLMNTNLLFVDNTYDIGNSGLSARPRNLYLSGTYAELRNTASVSVLLKSTTGQALLTLDAATTGTSNSNAINFTSDGTTRWTVGGGNISTGGDYDFTLFNAATSTIAMNVPGAGNNVFFPGELSINGASAANQPVTVQADTNGHSLWTVNDATLGYGQVYFGGSASSGYQGIRADGRVTGWLDVITNDTRRMRFNADGSASFYNGILTFDAAYPYFNNIASGSIKTIMAFNTSGAYYAALFDSGGSGATGSKMYWSRTSGVGAAYTNSLLTKDFHNAYIGINTPDPAYQLDIRGGGGSGTAGLRVRAATSGTAQVVLDSATNAGGAATQITYALAGTAKWSIGYANIGTGGANDFGAYNYIAGATPWILTSTSYQRLPYTAAFLVTVGTNYASTGTSTVDFDTVVYDNRNNFDTANNKFVAPVDGYYQFNVTVNQYGISAGTVFEIGIRKNSTTFAGERIYSGGSSDQNISTSMSVYLTAGDSVDVTSYTAGGFSASIRWNVFSGYLIG